MSAPKTSTYYVWEALWPFMPWTQYGKRWGTFEEAQSEALSMASFWVKGGESEKAAQGYCVAMRVRQVTETIHPVDIKGVVPWGQEGAAIALAEGEESGE